MAQEVASNALLESAEARATAEGKSISTMAREALEQYLTRR